jgi:hypothetical protein
MYPAHGRKKNIELVFGTGFFEVIGGGGLNLMKTVLFL